MGFREFPELAAELYSRCGDSVVIFLQRDQRKMKWAHSEGHDGQKEPLVEHLRRVGQLAADRAAALGAREEAYCVGLWHDAGKFGDEFQEVLAGKRTGVDHWSLGAFLAFDCWKGEARAAMLCILGHHMGIPDGNRETIRQWCPPAIYERHPQGLTLSPARFEDLKRLVQEAGINECMLPAGSFVPNELFAREPARAMLRTRFLFSCLVDADFVATERHFEGPDCRREAARLEPGRLWPGFQSLLAEARKSRCSEEVGKARETVLRAALEAAEWEERLLTLTAPTGSGKTLAMMGFALRRAQERGHRRIVVALPYLTLIHEVAELYERLFRLSYPGEDTNGMILEAHSLAELDRAPEEGDEGERTALRKLTENWDAPVVLTTNVQLLESLHSNRPFPCRKLHNLANSVILMDEVQTVPRHLAVPTLAALSTLTEDFGCSVLMATATQPAFQEFDGVVRSRLSATGWRPREIVPSPPELFQALRRVKVRWALQEDKWTEERVVDAMLEHDSVLCIVNVKRHAREIFQRLVQRDPRAKFLTTSLCPLHRKALLKEVREQLHSASVRLVSTQCVEAGVDLDFPCVMRAVGPLEAIAQAAGRCNRHGRMRLGECMVFEIADEGGRAFPDSAYEQAAQVTRLLLNEMGTGLDLFHPETYRRYYTRLFRFDLPELEEHALVRSIRSLSFPEVAKQYRLIPDAQISILVPYDAEQYGTLRGEVLRDGLSAKWIRRARPHSVSIYRPPREAPIWTALDTIPIRPRGESNEWFVLRDSQLYDPAMGLILPREFSFLEC